MLQAITGTQGNTRDLILDPFPEFASALFGKRHRAIKWKTARATPALNVIPGIQKIYKENEMCPMEDPVNASRLEKDGNFLKWDKIDSKQVENWRLSSHCYCWWFGGIFCKSDLFIQKIYPETGEPEGVRRQCHKQRECTMKTSASRHIWSLETS